jgi:hypothetical protein
VSSDKARAQPSPKADPLRSNMSSSLVWGSECFLPSAGGRAARLPGQQDEPDEESQAPVSRSCPHGRDGTRASPIGAWG